LRQVDHFKLFNNLSITSIPRPSGTLHPFLLLQPSEAVQRHPLL
jgi:hypothetical protein